MTGSLALNLDTNHLSELARSSNAADVQAVLCLLESGEARLAISYFHLLELAAPEFRSIDNVCALLRDAPSVLLNPFQDIEDEEIALVVARLTGNYRRPPRVFAASTAEWGYHIGPPGGGPADMLDAMEELQELRRQFLALAASGAQVSMMKTQAALIRQPLGPLTLAVRRHLEDRRERLPSYACGLSAEQIVERARGTGAFPMLDTHERFVAARLRQLDQKSTGNDLIDEYIASYAPYVAVTAVDRRTYHRAHIGRVPSIARITRYLTEVPGIAARVQRGELLAQESE